MASAVMLSGGSLLSWSLTWFASTVNVQVSPCTRVTPGSRVKVVGPPLKVVATAPLVEQTSVNQDADTLTGSLKVTVRLEPTGKVVEPLAGKVLTTAGAASAASSLTIVPTP